MDPKAIKITGTFEDSMAAHESKVAAANGNFKIMLKLNGIVVGWVGINKDGWCILSPKEDALAFSPYVQDNKTYYKVIGGAYDGYWLSINMNAYAGVYRWWGATSWRFLDRHLICDYNNQKLSLYSTSNQWLYAWDAYSVFDVEFLYV